MTFKTQIYNKFYLQKYNLYSQHNSVIKKENIVFGILNKIIYKIISRMSNSEFNSLRKLEYPQSAKEALTQIENIIINRNKQDFVMELIADYVFREKNKDIDSRKSIYQQSTHLTLIQEFQLVIVLSEFFSRPGPDATRNAVFLSLFGGNITPTRASVLVKLISTSVSASIAPLLCAAGTWMQQLGCTSIPSLQLVQSLIQDFVIFSKKTSEQLKQLPMVAPRFAANFMTAVADLYMNDMKNDNLIIPPDMLLEIFTEWVTDNPRLCLASQELLALPSGAIAMPVMTPLAGLIRWTVLSPILNQKGMYNKLHLALLETLLQIPPTNGPATALNAQHLVQIVNPLKSHACKLIAENLDPENDENFQTSLERFAQAVQVSLSSKCIYGSISQLLCMLETLPNNSLMDIVIKANKNT